MSWLVYFLLTLGPVYLLTESAIFLPYRILMRRLGAFATILAFCRACTGFWVGLTLNQYFPLMHPLRPLLSASCVMLVGYLWSVAIPNASFHSELGGDE